MPRIRLLLGYCMEQVQLNQSVWQPAILQLPHSMVGQQHLHRFTGLQSQGQDQYKAHMNQTHLPPFVMSAKQLSQQQGTQRLMSSHQMRMSQLLELHFSLLWQV